MRYVIPGGQYLGWSEDDPALVDLGHVCQSCGKPLLSCWDDGPAVSWHVSAADAVACAERQREDQRRQAEYERYAYGQPGIRL